MSAIEEARTVEVRTQERGRESWAISLTTETSTGGYTDTIRMTEAEARAVYAALGERLSAPPSDDERETLTELRLAAEAQRDAYARMLELGQGVGMLGVRHPEMFEAMLAWGERSENEHADTVLDLLDRLDAELLRRQGPITDEAVERAWIAYRDELGPEERVRMRAALEAAERVRSAVPSTTEQEQP